MYPLSFALPQRVRRWEKSLQFHAQAIGQPVDEGVVAGNLVDVEDAGVGKAGVTQSDDVGFDHAARLQGELFGVGEHGAVGGAEVGLPPVGFEVRYQRFVFGQTEQPGSVMGDSVVAVDGRGDDDADHFPFGTAQGGTAVHHRLV